MTKRVILYAFIWLVLTLIFPPLGVFILILVVAYQIYAYTYFNGQQFNSIRESIKKHTDNSNELNHHIQELKCSYVNVKSYDYGTSSLQDNSRYNFKRREWSNELRNNQVHNCTSTVCKNASAQPFKYLCKYFNIKTDEETLSNFENVLNDFAAAEQGKKLLLAERETILNSIKNDIPSLIYTLSKERLIKKLGFETVDLSDLHFPVYTFQYVSAGGNSSARCDIKLDVDNLDKFVNYLNDLVKFKNSIQGQRALMTSKLREFIKQRDNYTCKSCSISTHTERNLLLEIDHIIPLSKGGFTTESNLQTLCWRCNRTKGAKIL
ncbi:MAG: HNH endonuclease signature motif containing protein [Chitinophagales bacterium]